jgi:peptidoglycan/LPS O-acetylase OafA/YrhL
VVSWIGRHLPGWFFPHMMLWFVFGVFSGFNLAAFKGWLARWSTVLPWVALGLGVAAFIEWELLLKFSGRQWLPPTLTLLDSLYAFAFLATFLAWSPRLRLPQRLDAVGVQSYGVYLLHAPVLELVARASYHVAPPVLGHQFVFQVVLVACGVGVPLLFMALVNRSPARPYYNYLFG